MYFYNIVPELNDAWYFQAALQGWEIHNSLQSILIPASSYSISVLTSHIPSILLHSNPIYNPLYICI